MKLQALLFVMLFLFPFFFFFYWQNAGCLSSSKDLFFTTLSFSSPEVCAELKSEKQFKISAVSTVHYALSILCI